MEWTTDGSKYRLRSTGSGGILWIEDVASGDGMPVVMVNFQTADPSLTVEDGTCTLWSIDPVALKAALALSVTKWKSESP